MPVSLPPLLVAPTACAAGSTLPSTPHVLVTPASPTPCAEVTLATAGNPGLSLPLTLGLPSMASAAEARDAPRGTTDAERDTDSAHEERGGSGERDDNDDDDGHDGDDRRVSSEVGGAVGGWDG